MKKISLLLMLSLTTLCSAMAFAEGKITAQDKALNRSTIQPAGDNTTLGRACPPFC